MKITPQQVTLFVSEYLKSSNAPAAAQAAGINPRLAGRLLKDDAVKAELERQRAEPAEAAGATGPSASLIAFAREALRVAQADGNVNGQVAATKLLAELTGALKNPMAEQANVRAEDLSDDDLARIIGTCTCGALKKALTSKRESLPL
jgi:phage terminase small subunit